MGNYRIKKTLWTPPSLFKIPVKSLDQTDPVLRKYSENLFSTQATIFCNGDSYQVIGRKILLNNALLGVITKTYDSALYGEELIFQIEIGTDIIQVSRPDNPEISLTIRLDTEILGKGNIKPFFNPFLMNLSLTTHVDKYVEVQLLTLFIYIRDFRPEGTFVGG